MYTYGIIKTQRKREVHKMKTIINRCVARLKKEDDGSLTIIKTILKEEIERYKEETGVDQMDRWLYIYNEVMWKCWLYQ